MTLKSDLGEVKKKQRAYTVFSYIGKNNIYFFTFNKDIIVAGLLFIVFVIPNINI